MFEEEERDLVGLTCDSELFLTKKGAEFLVNWAKMTLQLWNMQGCPPDHMESDVATLMMVLSKPLLEAYEGVD